MRISWNWLSQLVDLSGVESPLALGELLTSRGLEVETIEKMDQGFEKVVTAQILDYRTHPQADRLNLCRVTLGNGEILEIVCGAPNVKAGAKVALAQVGAHLPNGLKIVSSQIRGVTSNGMLCSEAELKISDSSQGILILPESTPLGLPLADVLGRNDAILTLKLTANRGDCLSHYGMAREVGSALLRKPKPIQVDLLVLEKSLISVHLEAQEAAPQYFSCSMIGVKVGPSPDWMVKRLEALGVRSVNNVVDATQWVMLELGQPSHAYDQDQILGRQIQVRRARPGEVLPLLDGQTLVLDGLECVIADQERAIALAGVMGGGNSQVQLSTQNLFLECAEFDPVLTRRTSSRHQKKTDAAHRFERGVDPTGLPLAMARLVQLIQELAGGQREGAVFLSSVLASDSGQSPVVSFGVHYLNDFLGFERDKEPLTLSSVREILESLDCAVDCAVKQGEDSWFVTPPPYRLDLKIQEDFAEEIARTIGYDKIPTTLPALTSSPVFGASSLPRIQVMDRAKESLVQSGLRETLNFSFTSQARLARLGFASTVSILNPLSEEYAVMVPSLLPGLIQNTLDNWSHHFGSESLAIRLFELRPVFSTLAPIQARGQMETGVIETWKLAWVMTGPRFAGGLRCEQGSVDFYDLKAVMDHLLASLGTRGIRVIPQSTSRSGQNPLFHPGQSAEVLVGNSVAGQFGLLHPSLSRDLKCRTPIGLAELDWEVLTKLSRKASEFPLFRAWSEFPTIERDFALLVKDDVPAEKLCQIAIKSGKPLAKEAKVFDVYRGAQVGGGMTSVAVRVIFYDEQRSLQESEAEAASVRILENWKKELGAVLRG